MSDVWENGMEVGARLGCPDCIAGEDHCCPFLWALEQEPERRRWTLDHMRAYFESVGLYDEMRSTPKRPNAFVRACEWFTDLWLVPLARLADRIEARRG